MFRIILAAIGLILGGCMPPLANDQLSLLRHDVQPVMTEHSLALNCLGELIDQSKKPGMIVYIDRIDDETVPRRYDERRLSLGGAYWLHTAIDRLGSTRVVSTTRREIAKRAANGIILTGAWTQDDLGIGRLEGNVKGEWNGSSRDTELFIGSRRSSDIIAGDFMTVRNGVVTHATAISLAIDADRSGFGLRIEDGVRDLAFDLTRSTVEGPQFAQRRIAEAAAMVHLARAFDVDYGPCIEFGWAGAPAFQELAAGYFAMTDAERRRSVQEMLNAAGYKAGSTDGIWGARSRKALMAFQARQGLPVTGRLSVQVFLALHRPARDMFSSR